MIQITPEELSTELQRAVQQAINRALDSEIEEAKLRLEKKIRSNTAGIASTVLHEFQMHRMGQDLVITVKFPKDK